MQKKNVVIIPTPEQTRVTLNGRTQELFEYDRLVKALPGQQLKDVNIVLEFPCLPEFEGVDVADLFIPSDKFFCVRPDVLHASVIATNVGLDEQYGTFVVATS